MIGVAWMDYSKFLNKLMKMHIKWIFQVSIMFLLFSMLLTIFSLIQVEIRGRILLKRGGMMGSKMGLVLKITETMQGLMQSTWDEFSKSSTFKMRLEG